VLAPPVWGKTDITLCDDDGIIDSDMSDPPHA
jgi:hypothetical protein